MAQKYHPKTHRKTKKDHKTEQVSDNIPRIVAKRYNVTAQTAYHITKLALQENTTEGRIIDKIMRTYLASRNCQS